MLDRYLLVMCGMVGLAAGHIWLWQNRPTAEPMDPALYVSPTTTPALPVQQARPQQPAPAPRPELDLSFPSTAAVGDGSGTAALRDAPRLELKTGPNSRIRPMFEAPPELFDDEHGGRGISPGYWMSDKLRLRGGVGYTEDPNTRDRDIAVGLGVDIGVD